MLFRKGSSPLTCQYIFNPVVAEIDQRVPEEDEMLERYQPTGPILWACGGNIRHGDDPADITEGGYVPE